MSWFSKAPEQTDVEKLNEKSNNIVSVFRQTAEDLKAVNLEIEAASKEKIDLMKQLDDEVKELAITGVKNSNIIAKIENILG